MIKYKCKYCDLTTEFSDCPHCGQRTNIVETAVYWCKECNIPVFEENCSICKQKAKRIGADIRPVFPEERLLLEILLGKPMCFKEASVWNTAGNFYYVNGKKIDFTVGQTKSMDVELVRQQLQKYGSENTYTFFNQYIDKFIAANKERYEFITSEATQFVRDVAGLYDLSEMYVSFSGGKDSTVTSNLVMRALSNEQILHLYGDTTLEFPETKEYIARFKSDHPKTLLLTAKNKDKDFATLCERLGPPARQLRWCCTVFKTGAIQRKMQSIFRNKRRVLTFYGIRRHESTSRSKYDRESDSPKIAIQKTVSPIIDWLDFDIWLYLLTTGIDFNSAYRLGYTRVGCWCCPNNSIWSEFMSKIYMPEQSAYFRSMLIDFAKKIGKPDPEVYVDDGKWKARQGGNGLEYAQTSVLSFEPCALQENTLNFELQKPITEEFYEFFKPFGWINKELGNPRLGEVYVTDQNGELLLRLQGKIGSTTLKVGMLKKNAGHCVSFRALEDKIKCQITKYQMCMGCLGCESVCPKAAINIQTDRVGLLSYKINDEKCVRCGSCINHFDGGCYMRKVMVIKRS